ncbi:MAG: MarR family winged helix-turn-helix transcriptional regulator [bacterium]
MQRPEYQTAIIREVMLLARQWEYYLNQRLSETGITFPQVTLLSTVEQYGDTAPTVSEAAESLLMSHQNVMRLARPLEREGFLEIRKDSSDRRVLRLHLTQKNYDFWAAFQERSIREIEELYRGVQDEELEQLYSRLEELLERAIALRNHTT